MRILILLLLALPAYSQTMLGPGESHTVTAQECPAAQQPNMLVSVGLGGWFVEVTPVSQEDHVNVGEVIAELGAAGLVMQFSSGWRFDYEHGQSFPEPGAWMLLPGGLA